MIAASLRIGDGWPLGARSGLWRAVAVQVQAVGLKPKTVDSVKRGGYLPLNDRIAAVTAGPFLAAEREGQTDAGGAGGSKIYGRHRP